MKLVVSSVLVAVAASGCYRHHRRAAPPAPTPVIPEVSAVGDPGPGRGRVLLDVQEGPAVVERVQGASASGVAGSRMLSGALEISRRVCVTPCVLDIDHGPHELRFTLVDDDERTSTGFVNVDSRPSAYRHAIGVRRNDAWKGFVGWPVLVLGAVVDIGLATAIANGDFEANGPNLAGAGIAVGLTALGAWLVHGAIVEQQPGSGVQWHP